MKAIALKSVDDVPRIEAAVAKNAIVILKVTPLAERSLDELRTSLERLHAFVTSAGGSIAKLGDERVVITPPGVRISSGPG